MYRLNPNAVALWALLAIVGYIADGNHGALVLLAVGLGVSLLVTFLAGPGPRR